MSRLYACLRMGASLPEIFEGVDLKALDFHVICSIYNKFSLSSVLSTIHLNRGDIFNLDLF